MINTNEKINGGGEKTKNGKYKFSLSRILDTGVSDNFIIPLDKEFDMIWGYND